MSDLCPKASTQERVALVTGASGFVGRHLVEALLRDIKWHVIGLSRAPSNFEHPRYQAVTGDIQSDIQVRRVLAERGADVVFHLAAATPPVGDALLYSTNVGGTSNLLEAVYASSPRARMLIVGSDAQYGRLPPRHIPTSEQAPMHPVGSYGRSKVLQERVARQFWRMTDLPVICVRPFNHIGPGQSSRFVVSALAHQIALAEAGLGPTTIQIGRTDTARDFTDVRDVVRAYLTCMVDGRIGDIYNVGSGTTRRIADIAEMLATLAGTAVTFESVSGPTRSGDVLVTQCDATRLHEQTGWSPSIPIEQTLADTLGHWRAVVQSESPKQGVEVTPEGPR